MDTPPFDRLVEVAFGDPRSMDITRRPSTVSMLKFTQDDVDFQFILSKDHRSATVKAYGAQGNTGDMGLDLLEEYGADFAAWAELAQETLMRLGLIDYDEELGGWYNVDHEDEIRDEMAAEADYRREVSSVYLSGRF